MRIQPRFVNVNLEDKIPVKGGGNDNPMDWSCMKHAKLLLWQRFWDVVECGSSLTKHVALTEAKDSNLCLSPSSIRELLSLIAAGSKGPTLDQLLSFLKSKSNDQLNTYASELVAVILPTEARAAGPAYPQPMLFGLISRFLSGIPSNRLSTISTKLLLIKSISKPRFKRLLKYLEK